MHVLIFLLFLSFFSLAISEQNLLVPVSPLTNSLSIGSTGSQGFQEEDPLPLLLGLDRWNSLRWVDANNTVSINYDLQNFKCISSVKLEVNQSPPSITIHHVTGGKQNYGEVELCKFEQDTKTGDILSCNIDCSQNPQLRYITISTLRAESWVQWQNITIVGRDTIDSPEYQIAPVKPTNDDFPDIYVGDEKYGRALSLVFGSENRWNSAKTATSYNPVIITYDFKKTVVIESLHLVMDHSRGKTHNVVTIYDSLRQNKVEIANFKDIEYMSQDLATSEGHPLLARYLTIETLASTTPVKWQAIEIYGYPWEDFMPLKK